MKKNRRFYLFIGLIAILLIGVLAESAFAQADPGVRGPRAVTRQEYTFGDTAFTPSGFPGPVELTGSVHAPTDLSGGPFPVIVLLHGRHATCYQGGAAFLQWPCTPPRQPIPSYRGYDYVSDILASWGYIVISISANGISARDNSVFDLGMNARAQLIQRHLDIWSDFNTVGGAPFGTRFIGRLDLSNVGTMGHSRGGEGVVTHYIYNASQGSPYGINAVFLLAPVDFSRPVINNVPLAVLLPYCDGDVFDLQGIHFYDDARYNVPGDTAPKHTILVMGANHDFYNTIWSPGGWPAGTADDWLFTPGGSFDPYCGTGPGNQRLSQAGQRGTGLAYIVGFFRLYIGGDDFGGYFTGDFPPPPSATTDQISVSYHAPDDPSTRRDVNRLLTAANLTTNTLGGAVTQTGLTPYDLCGGDAPQPQHCLTSRPRFGMEGQQPHTTPSARSPRRGLSQLRFGWSNTLAQYKNDLPPGVRDVSGYYALQFRASVNFEDVRNPVGMAQNVSVTLTDGAGNSATALVSDWSNALSYPPGQTFATVPKVVLNTVRIPLFAFTGVNLNDIRSVTLNFDQTNSGALLVTDLAFAN